MSQRNQDLESSACQFYENCDLRNSSSSACQSDSLAKNYYGINRPCGCYRKMLRNEKGIAKKVNDEI